MKKIYLILSLITASFVSNAQYDIAVTLDNYTADQATSDNPLDLSFTISNEGTSAVAAGDSIYWSVQIGTTSYTTDDLTEGFFIYSILAADFAAGASTTIDVTDISMDWAYAELGGLNGDICILAGVNPFSAVAETNVLNNIVCVDYTVTAVTSVEENNLEVLSVYPNPATDVLNINLNEDADMITIYSLDGKIVMNEVVNNSLITLEVSELEAGMYIYEVSTKDGEKIRNSFIKQ